MEEQRQRQEDEARRASVVSAAEAGVPSPADGKRVSTTQFGTQSYSVVLLEFSSFAKCSLLIPSFVSFVSVAESEEALLKMSVTQTDTATPALPDFSRMTEDEQIAYALQMSMQGGGWSLKTFEKHDLDLHIDIQLSITIIHIGLQCKFVPLSQRLEVRTWTLGLTWNPLRPR